MSAHLKNGKITFSPAGRVLYLSQEAIFFGMDENLIDILLRTDKHDCLCPEPTLILERRNYIICVGIDKYQPAAGMDELFACKNDCIELATLLVEDYDFRVLPYYSEQNKTEIRKPMMLFDEEATTIDIERFFDSLNEHPRFSRANTNETAHNLVIFLSGHGILQKNNEEDLFYWVPYDFDGKDPSKRLYSINDLMHAVGMIRYHHLILVSDACHSGGALPFANRFAAQAPKNTMEDYRDIRSCWGICSCNADQQSYTTTTRSIFTGKLITVLKNDSAEEFNIIKMLEDLDDVCKKTEQRPVHGRIGSLKQSNGKFYFTPSERKKERVNLLTIQNSLGDNMSKLNYRQQAGKLGQLADQHTVVVISSQQGSALKLLLRSARENNLFPVLNQLIIIEEKNLGMAYTNTPLNKLLALFREAIQATCKDEDELVATLAAKLKITNVVVGINLLRKTTDNNELIKAMVRITTRLHGLALPNCLYFIVLDENNTDYSSLKNAVLPFTLAVIDGQIFITQNDFTNWRNFIVPRMQSPDVKQLFDSRIYNGFTATLSLPGSTNNNILPSVAIKTICQLADYPALADALLNSIDHLPRNNTP